MWLPAEALGGALPILRYGAPVLAGAIAARFGRARVVLAVAALALTDLAYARLAATSIQPLLALALPLAMVALAIGGEHGFRSAWTVGRAAAVGLLVAAVWWLGRAGAGPSWISYGFTADRWTAWTPLPDLPLLGALAGVGFFATRAVLRLDPVNRGFLWATIAGLAALHTVPGSTGPALLFGTAQLVLAVAVTEESYALAYRDGLTGLPSRRALNDALRRLARHSTVAMADIDRFKQLNDSYGHAVGDQVLRLVATRLRRVGGGGRVYRYGGEEFAILFPRTTLDEALPHLEAARANVEAATFSLRGLDRPRRRPKRPRPARRAVTTVGVTVSIGATQGKETDTVEELLRTADKALYRAKKQGRNRVVAHRSRQRVAKS